MRPQQTIKKSVSCSGVGLHTGCLVQMTLHPALVDSGIVFSRADLNVRIPALVSYVSTSNYASSLGLDGVEIRTVEHLLAAIGALHVDNLLIVLDGPEVPIMDGSSLSFVELLEEAEIVSQSRVTPHIKILETIEVQEGGRSISIRPSESPKITYALEYPHPLLSYQVFDYDCAPDAFKRELASARTFGFLSDVESLHSNGLARGGSLENVIVLGEDQILNAEGLRYPNEFIRHKVLDLVGDFTLLGMPFIGHIEAHRSGHTLNIRLVSAILESNSHWTLVGASVAPDRSVQCVRS